MQKFKKIALAGAVGGLMLSAGAANAHVSYNLSNDPSVGAAPSNGNYPLAEDWTGGAYAQTGTLPINWWAHIHNAGGVANSQTASSADAIADGALGIAVGARAYKDGATNWGHNADFTLFNLEHDATVTISVSSDNSSLRPAFGLWSGYDTASGNRHATFLSNGAINPMAANPFAGDAGISLVADNGSTAWAVAAAQGTPSTPATATLSRYLTAGWYTLAIGGYDGTVAGQHAYTTTISAAAVPVPAAVWLFGSALAGMGVIGRRKQPVAS